MTAKLLHLQICTYYFNLVWVIIHEFQDISKRLARVSIRILSLE